MTSLIVDASIAVKWYVEEPSRAEARSLITGGYTLLAPDLVVAEVGSALWKRCKRGEMTRDAAAEIVDEVVSTFDQLVPMSTLGRHAMVQAATLRHPIYDCFYIALSQREAAPLITADARLLSLAGRIPGVEIRALGA